MWFGLGLVKGIEGMRVKIVKRFGGIRVGSLEVELEVGLYRVSGV